MDDDIDFAQFKSPNQDEELRPDDPIDPVDEGANLLEQIEKMLDKKIYIQFWDMVMAVRKGNIRRRIFGGEEIAGI